MTNKVATKLQNDVVARIPTGSHRARPEKAGLLTPNRIKAVPDNIIFATLTVLDPPRPIRKRRRATKR
jgi:hypothetical protein